MVSVPASRPGDPGRKWVLVLAAAQLKNFNHHRVARNYPHVVLKTTHQLTRTLDYEPKQDGETMNTVPQQPDGAIGGNKKEKRKSELRIDRIS